jgi:hypothetical protein
MAFNQGTYPLHLFASILIDTLCFFARYKIVEIFTGQVSVYIGGLSKEAFMKAIKDSRYLSAVRRGGVGLFIFFAVKGAIYALLIVSGYFFIS